MKQQDTAKKNMPTILSIQLLFLKLMMRLTAFHLILHRQILIYRSSHTTINAPVATGSCYLKTNLNAFPALMSMNIALSAHSMQTISKFVLNAELGLCQLSTKQPVFISSLAAESTLTSSLQNFPAWLLEQLLILSLSTSALNASQDSSGIWKTLPGHADLATSRLILRTLIIVSSAHHPWDARTVTRTTFLTLARAGACCQLRIARLTLRSTKTTALIISARNACKGTSETRLNANSVYHHY